jgi:ribonuclease BN (tRNA processing enzyme)
MSAVTLRFAGSGDAFASGGRFNACLYLDGGGEPLLVDCGATSLVALKRAVIDPARIGWIALSHLHGDHFGGIPFLVLDGQFSGRTRPLVVAGPPGTPERVEQTFEALYPGSWSAEREFAVEFATLKHGVECELGSAVITPFEVQHGGGAVPYALRVEYGKKVIAYSGDTEWTDALVDVATGADLFVCECNFFDSQVPGHLDYRTLSHNRAKLGCERIVLTHLGDEMLANLDEVNIDVAEDGLALEL